MIYYFDIESNNGFFSVFFFLLSSYIYCCKNNHILYLKDDKFKYAYKNGWDDYFLFNHELVKFDKNIPGEKIRFRHCIEPDVKHTLNEYKTYSKRIYKIKSNILKKYYHLPDEYNSIYIRGGDKTMIEAIKHPVCDYVSLLLSLNLKTSNLFVHSDDNLLVEEIKNYILENNIDLKVFKITDEKQNGGSVSKKIFRHGKCRNILSIEEMNKEQKKEHMISFLTSIEILRKSDNVIVSFDSNVSRFMKINFNCNVYDIHSNNLNFNTPVKNPAHNF